MFGAVTGDTKKNLMEGFKIYLPLGYICIQSHVVNERLKIQGVVHSALDIFLGNTSAGQKEETKYFVYLHHNAIVRIDVKVSDTKFEYELPLTEPNSFGAGTSSEKVSATHINPF
jgi:hypothetical protein